MAKQGAAKNSQNKAKHTKLMNRKKKKLRNTKESTRARLKELNRKINEQKLRDL
jgi:hypothetical protein